MIRRLTAIAVLIPTLALAACSGGASTALPSPSPPTTSGTPVSPPVFATAFNQNPPTPTAAMAATITAARTEAALPGPPPIIGFSFVSADEGWLLRDGPEVLHTTDAGATWHVQYDVPDIVPSAVQFIDAQHGWIVGASGGGFCQNIGFYLIGPTCTGALLTTADGGATWRLTTPSPLPITGVSFADARNGFAVAARSCGTCAPEQLSLLHTSDGGASWTSRSVGKPEQFPSGQIATVDPAHAVVVSTETTYATGDAGATWQTSPSPCLQPATWGIAATPARLVMLDELTGWALCRDGGAAGMLGSNLYQTHDGGAHWTMISQYVAPKKLLAYGIGEFPGGAGQLQFFDALHGRYAPAQHTDWLCSTDDGGHTWACPHTDAHLEGVFFLQFADPDHGYIADLYGLARTTDGGMHWTDLELPK